MTTLWLIRHGETDWNVEHRFQGSSDQLLNANGEAQAQSLSPRLAAMRFDAIYASDLIRVQRTAELALEDQDNKVELDPRLRELDFGMWEGLTWDEARDRDPVAFKQWAADRNTNPHGGETTNQVVARLNDFLSDLHDATTRDDQVLIFAHGGTLATLLCLLLGSDPNRWWQYRFLNCSLNEVILVNRGAILTRLNDTSHLPPAI